MAISLSQLNRTNVPKPPRILIHGVAGVGKTTFAAESRSPVFVQTEDGLGTLAATSFPLARTYEEVMGALAALYTEAHEHSTVVIDTAGRLHTKTGLMDELGKVKRVIEKQSPVDEVILVLDATTGQNGLTQAKVFSEVVDVTGIALTKLDGTAKGGIVVAVQRELGVPVKLVGLGEGPDDLAPFDPAAFVNALLA